VAASSRAALLDAAFEEFTTKGYEATTVAGIAARAGVTTGALYAHFSGKLDVLLATVDLKPADEIVQSVEELASLPWSEAVKRLVEGLSARPDRRRLLLLDVIVAAGRDPRVATILRGGLETYVREIGRANDAGVAHGLLDPPMGTDDLARVLVLLNLGKVVVEALGGTPPSDDAFEQLAALLLQTADPSDATHEPALARVRGRAAAAARARQALEDAIGEALVAGHSLRQIGAAAGLSHERIRQLAAATVNTSDT
jgi:AcrR family transcriptional regulator